MADLRALAGLWNGKQKLVSSTKANVSPTPDSVYPRIAVQTTEQGITFYAKILI